MGPLRVFVMVACALLTVTSANNRMRRQFNSIVGGNACPDGNTNICRTCVCSPTTARYVKNGNVLVAPVGGLPPSSDSTCDQCCFQELVVTPQCPIDTATNTVRPTLTGTTNFGLQNVANQARSYVGCCPFTPCQTGYSCMFDRSNAKWLCCGVGGAAPTAPPTDRCASGIPANGQCANGVCGVGFTCERSISGRMLCCPGAPTAPPTFPTSPPQTGQFGCASGTNALIYRTPAGVIPQPAVPVVGCLELGATRCPSGTTCQAHNRPVTVSWKAGICCVPNGVNQNTIPILV